MAEFRRQCSVEDDPPSYKNAVDSGDNIKGTADTGILPVYTKFPEQPDPTHGKSTWKRYKIRIMWLILGIFAITGGVSGGLLQKKSKGHFSVANNQYLSSGEKVTSLASAECGSGSFIFFQTNTSIIYVRGRLKNRPLNITKFDAVSTSLDLKGSSAPMLSTNLTAVCSTDSVTPGARIYLYYHVKRQFHYTLNEAVFTLPYGIEDFNNPAPLSVYTTIHEVVNQTAPSSLSAIYVPSSGPKVYYFAQGAAGLIYLFEVSRDSWPISNFSAAPIMLDALIRDIGAPLATAVAEPYLANIGGLQEIQVFFSDSDSHLSRLMFNRDTGWNRAQKLATMYNSAYINVDMNKVAAVIPHVYKNITAPLLYYILDGRVNQLSTSIPLPPATRDETAVNFTVSDPSVKYNFPFAVAEPGLIAVSAWNEQWNRSMSIDALGNAGSNDGVESLHIIFVNPYDAPMNRGEEYLLVENKEFGIVNVTGKSEIFGGFE